MVDEFADVGLEVVGVPDPRAASVHAEFVVADDGDAAALLLEAEPEDLFDAFAPVGEVGFPAAVFEDEVGEPVGGLRAGVEDFPGSGVNDLVVGYGRRRPGGYLGEGRRRRCGRRRLLCRPAPLGGGGDGLSECPPLFAHADTFVRCGHEGDGLELRQGRL